MFSANIKPDERDLLFTGKMIYCLKLMIDLKSSFHCKYLRKVDKGKVLISVVYRIAQKIAEEIETLNFEESENFLNISIR